MSDDPIQDLEELNQQGLTVNPLPPSEVRRLGDRMRRRKTALAAVGAAAAVAVIVTPLTVLANGGDHAEPPIANPSVTTSQAPSGRIPDDFSLEITYPATNEDGTPVETTGEPGVGAMTLCGKQIWSPSGALEVAGASYSGSEDFRARTLAVYGSEAGAKAAIAQARYGLGGCPSESTGGTVSVYNPVNLQQGDASFAFTQRYRGDTGFDTGLTVYDFVRVGNALLVSTSYAEGGGSAQAIAQMIALSADETQSVVDQMGVFAGQPDAAPSGLSDAALLEADDVPARSRLSAWEQSPPLDTPTLACQPEPLASLGAETLVHREFRAHIADSEGGIPASEVNTAVLAFADDAAASAAYDTVAAWVRDCPAPENAVRPLAQKEKGVNRSGSGTERSQWRQRNFYGKDVCTDCDAIWFDRMGMAQLGDRLVLVSCSEIGGPLEPGGLDATMTTLFAAAVDKARP